MPHLENSSAQWWGFRSIDDSISDEQNTLCASKEPPPPTDVQFSQIWKDTVVNDQEKTKFHCRSLQRTTQGTFWKEYNRKPPAYRHCRRRQSYSRAPSLDTEMWFCLSLNVNASDMKETICNLLTLCHFLLLSCSVALAFCLKWRLKSDH